MAPKATTKAAPKAAETDNAVNTADSTGTQGTIVQNLVVGTLTQEKIDALKQQYGRVRFIRIKVSATETSIGYYKEPDRSVTAMAFSKRSQNKPVECGETLLDNCFIGGDERQKTVDKIRVNAALAAYDLFDFLETSTGEA